MNAADGQSASAARVQRGIKRAAVTVFVH
jgi:hypothetical protein